MNRSFKNIIKSLKATNYKSLLGILVGLLLFIIVYKFTNVLLLAILIGIILSIVSIILIQIYDLNKFAQNYEENHKKNKSIAPEDIRGINDKIDSLLDLDKEILDFYNKYSSNKYYEKELNKQWSIHGDEFIKRADEILSKMSNSDILYSLLATEIVQQIVDIFKYFKPYKINIELLKSHPEKAIDYYIETLMQEDAIKKFAINDYFYNRIMELNYFKEIEKFILTNMPSTEIYELSKSSDDWREKLYYYGFLK